MSEVSEVMLGAVRCPGCGCALHPHPPDWTEHKCAGGSTIYWGGRWEPASDVILALRGLLEAAGDALAAARAVLQEESGIDHPWLCDGIRQAQAVARGEAERLPPEPEEY